MIQRWSGHVESFDGTTLFVRLHDQTNPSNPDAVAKIPLAKIVGRKNHRLAEHPGAMFTWTIQVRYVKRGVKGRKEVTSSRQAVQRGKPVTPSSDTWS